MRIGVIGCGTIASAAVRAIARDGHRITVSERGRSHSAALAADYDSVAVADNQGVLDAADVVFLGLMAEIAGDVLGALRFREGQRVISFMAGATLARADAMVRPARAVALMMPFPGIAQGGTPIMMQGDADLVGALFGQRNTVFPLASDVEMSAHLAAQAVLSPITRMVAEAADWLAERTADRAAGEAFLRSLVAANLAQSDCAALLAALDTPGGYNQRLRRHMDAHGIAGALRTGLDTLG